jgi:type VI secretion system secreted protein Hcp
MATQRGKARMVTIVCALAALSGLSLMALAGDAGLYGVSADSSAPPIPGVIIAPPTTTTAAAGFIKFDGVDGESQDTDHRTWSDLLSFSQGQFVPVDAATGRARGGVVFEDIVVTKELDKASPKLAEAVCKGQVFPNVQIHWTRAVAGGARQTYYAYELKNVQITSYSIGGSAQSDTAPTEQISLNFEEIKATYTEFGDTGQAKGNVEYTWKVEEGEK